MERTNQTDRQRFLWLTNMLIPVLIFVISALFPRVFLLDILPKQDVYQETWEDFLRPIGIPFSVGMNLGVFAITLYYFDWRRQKSRDSDRLAIRLLYLALTWLVLHMFAIVPLLAGHDSVIKDEDYGCCYPTMGERIVFLIAWVNWGRLCIRVGYEITDETPLFMILTIWLCRISFLLIFLPTLLAFIFPFFRST
jgi:hypothetical protein